MRKAISFFILAAILLSAFSYARPFTYSNICANGKVVTGQTPAEAKAKCP